MRHRGMFVANFAGGMNNSVPPTEIADDESAFIQNFEFDLEDNLGFRPGIIEVTETPPPAYDPLDPDFNRITSMHEHWYDSQAFLITLGDRVYDYALGIWTDLTGALSFPVNTLWQWTSLGGWSCGVNDGYSDNYVIWQTGDAAVSVPAQKADIPQARSITVWKRRVAILDWAGSLHLSPIDDPTWQAAGNVTLEIDRGTNDESVSLAVFRGALYIFKRNSIYKLWADRSDDTDPTNWRVDRVTEHLGCIARNSVKVIFDDVLFLSNAGITSLKLTEKDLGIETSIISQNVNRLLSSNVSLSDAVAGVNLLRDQYWLSFIYDHPYGYPPDQNNLVIVGDRDTRRNRYRFTTYTNLACGSSFMSSMQVPQHFFIGQYDGKIYRQVDPARGENIWDDEGEAVGRIIRTRAFTQGDHIQKKQWGRWGLEMEAKSDPLTLLWAISLSGTTSFDYNGEVTLRDKLESGAIWNLSFWGDETSIWATGGVVNFEFIKRVHGKRGSFSNLIQFQFSSQDPNQAFLLKSFFLEGAPAGSWGLTDIIP